MLFAASCALLVYGSVTGRATAAVWRSGAVLRSSGLARSRLADPTSSRSGRSTQPTMGLVFDEKAGRRQKIPAIASVVAVAALAAALFAPAAALAAPPPAAAEIRSLVAAGAPRSDPAMRWDGIDERLSM